MLKAPLFSIIPLIDSFYLEQIGSRKISLKENRSIKKSIKTLSNKTETPIRWVFVKYNDKEYPVLLKKGKDCDIIIGGPEPVRLKKAKVEKDLEYWKKKLLDIMRVEKSLDDILFPDSMEKSLEIEDLLLKARGFAVGTIRKWSGKEYKKMGSGKWVRTYGETESRGAKQAIRNVQKKILDASTMEELLEIVKQNASRFQDKDGKMLPIVKEFIASARGTEAGKKEKVEPEVKVEETVKDPEQTALGYFKVDEEEAESVIDSLNDKGINGVEFYFSEDDDEIEFLAEVDRPEFTEHIRINPYDLSKMDDQGIKDFLSIEEKEVSKETRGEDKKKRKSRADVALEAKVEDGLEEAYDPTLDPSSEEYRFKDTGYIEGSRKELAADQIKDAKKDGRNVSKREIDWVGLEANPREARELIKKSNIFGQVDWELLKTDGMESGAGFLIDRIYASISKEPEDDPLARQDYTYGLESVRERLEKAKTPDDVTQVLQQMMEEYQGEILSAKESDEVQELTEKIKPISKGIREKVDERERLVRLWHNANSNISQTNYEISKREKRGWKPKPELEEQKKQYEKEAEDTHKEYRDYQEKYPESNWDDKDSEPVRTLKELRDKRTDVVNSAIMANLASNPFTRSWRALGPKFVSIINYRGYKGSKTFKEHITNAKFGKYEDWKWAEKGDIKGKKARKESVKFQLKVAENYNRKGGKKVSVSSTQELKEQFNLREVQSGNWVLRDPVSAKFHVEKSAEAFSDLADITGIPDDKISFNGRLAMAFGARGKGSAGFGGAAKAHYEPVQRVINLTKMGGGGSLAHEWFHSLDNLLSEAYGTKDSKMDDMLTDNPTLIDNEDISTAYAELIQSMNAGDKVAYSPMKYTANDYRNGKYNFDNPRSNLTKSLAESKTVDDAIDIIDAIYEPKIEQYQTKMDNTDNEYTKKSYKKYLNRATKQSNGWKKIIIAFKDGDPNGGSVKVPSERGVSSFKQGATDLDNGSKSGYWSSSPEMAARAFAAYAEDKLSDQNRLNDYLAVYSDNKYYKDSLFGDRFPFPEGEERTKINKSMEKLFEAIKRNDIIKKALDIVN